MDDTLASITPDSITSEDLRRFCFSLEKSDHAALAANPLLAPAATRSRIIQEQFFDTDHFDLAKRGISLRLCKIGRKRSMTLCQGDTVIDAALSSPFPDLSIFGPAWHATLTELTQGLALKPFANAKITQNLRQFGTAVVVFDSGFLDVGSHKLAFSEIEVIAPALSLADIALALTHIANLRYQPETRGMRAVRLAGGPVPALRTAAPGLQGNLSLDESIARVIHACLDQFIANWPVFYEGDEVGAVHQMRVAMRRLRSALGLFNRVLPTASFLSLRLEAKRIAGIMGEARNWDVFIDALQTGPVAAFGHEVGFSALEAQCEAYRQAGYKQIDKLLKHPDTTRFLLTAMALLAQRGWRATLTAESLPRLSEPARLMAAQALERLHRKLRKHGKKLVELPIDELHLARIELKKLRYAAAFFGGLFKPDGRVRHFNRAAAHLQDELGKLNDLATAESLTGRLKGDSPEAQRALGIVLGWMAHASLGEPHTLATAWKEFIDARLFT